jgi:colanic acid/amylovoran biosynthesis glycosyltransferase
VIAHAIRSYLPRTETFVQNQVTALRRHRAVVICHHLQPDTDFRFDPVVAAADVLAPPLVGLDRLAYRSARVMPPWTTRALAGAVRRSEAQLLHYHFLTDARFLLGLKRESGLPAVASAYGYDVSAFPATWKGLGKRYLRPIFEQLDCFLAMTEDMERDLIAIGCPADKIRVHYHGSDTRRFRFPRRTYQKNGPLTVLCCGRLEPRKAQHLVLRALRGIQRGPRIPFKVVIVGEGAMRGRLERMVAAYGWEDRATLTGHVPYTSDALVRHFHDADIFALPSITVNGLKEGIPGVVVEAMASGLPVVSSNHAGIPTVIRSGRDGLLVDEGDVEGLAGVLETLLTDASLREQLGQSAARRAADELDLGQRTVVLERIYDSLL